jgi:hypothetical protein
MTVIERVREWIKENMAVIEWTGAGVVYTEDLENYLDSLSAERCVWEEKPDPDFDGAHYYETQCGLLMDDETAYGWFQGDTSHWGNCRCGKRIEVKEE